MTVEQVRNAVMDAVVSHPPREVTVVDVWGGRYKGTITFAGQNKFRLDTPLSAMFFTYDETENVV